MFDKIIDFIVVSSVDPHRWSLTVKATGLALIPYILDLFSVTCGFGLVCMPDSFQSDLEMLMIMASAFAFAALTVIAHFAAIYGLIRKIYRTATGQNIAMNTRPD